MRIYTDNLENGGKQKQGNRAYVAAKPVSMQLHLNGLLSYHVQESTSNSNAVFQFGPL